MRAADAFRVTWSASCSSRIRHRNALTEKAWEGAVQGLGVKIVNYDQQIIFVFGLDEEIKILRPRPILAVLGIFFIQLFPNWRACSPITYTNCCIDVDILHYYVPSSILTYM